MRKICVVSSNSTIDSIIDPRFGRGAFLIFLDEKGDIEETIPNPGVETFSRCSNLKRYWPKFFSGLTVFRYKNFSSSYWCFSERSF